MKLRPRKDMAGICWPAIPSPRGSRLLALLYQLQESERWSADALMEAQQEQWALLFSHARSEAPLYAGRLPERTPDLGGPAWLAIPLLDREDVQARVADLHSRSVPPSHGRIFENTTSGSTGQPVVVRRTELLQLIWEAITLREHFWMRRDVSLTKAVIRATGPSARAPDGLHLQSWGRPYSALWRCGRSFALDLRTDVAMQAAWLRRVRPDYLLTYPTNLEAVLEELAAGECIAMREVLCVGEAVSTRLRERCTELTGARVTGNYSSQELGYLALECPDCAQLHVQAESVYLEVLDDAGVSCPPHTVGRVVVTDLHNFAMPLIRYVTGDYAEVGEPCPAGRGLPSLRRVLGRRRNMLLFPDGRRSFPLTGFARFAEVAPVRQYQFIQRTLTDIEVRIVVPEPLDAPALGALSALIVEALGYPFRLSFRQSRQLLPRTRGGKFEEFVCLVQ